jgi:hypothetical protein
MLGGEMRTVETAKSWAEVVIFSLTDYWAKKLNAQETAVLLLVTRLTLLSGRAVEDITMKQFVDCFSTSDRTLQKTIDSLCESDLINIYTVLSPKTGRQCSIRAFEINFKKLLDVTILEKIGRQSRLVPKENPQLAAEDSSGGAHEYIHRYCVPLSTSSGLDKSNQFPSAVYSPPKTMTVEVFSGNRNSQKPTTATKAQAARRGATPPASRLYETGLTPKRLQDLLDEIMSRYYPDYPRLLVTTKPYGVLRKRLEASNISDIEDFLGYAFRYWHELATRNQIAIRRLEPGALMDPLPLGPSFGDLAYRLPYFIRAYSSELARRQACNGKAAETIHREQIERLKRTLGQERHLVSRFASRIRALEEQLRQLRSSDISEKLDRSTPTARTNARKPPVDIDSALLDDTPIPEWT